MSSCCSVALLARSLGGGEGISFSSCFLVRVLGAGAGAGAGTSVRSSNPSIHPPIDLSIYLSIRLSIHTYTVRIERIVRWTYRPTGSDNPIVCHPVPQDDSARALAEETTTTTIYYSPSSWSTNERTNERTPMMSRDSVSRGGFERLGINETICPVMTLSSIVWFFCLGTKKSFQSVQAPPGLRTRG